MSISAFTDKQHEPSQTEIQEVIGIRLSLWDELSCYIKETYAPTEDFSYLYGKNYGWGLRFRVKGKLLTALYPSNGVFIVQIILSSKDIETVQSMNTEKNIRLAIENANPYPEGRWLFIPVESLTDIQDIQQVLELKVRTNRLKKH
jgi:hypothetical protein